MIHISPPNLVLAPRRHCLLRTGEEIKKMATCKYWRDQPDSLIGFFLDRPINRIGSTGWDFLADLLLDRDMVKSTLARAKGAMQ